VAANDATSVGKTIRARPIGRIESGRGQTRLNFLPDAR
jgi:hypothetical protein